MTATSPTRVSMHELLASCAAADAVSRPPKDFECPEGATKGARGTARETTTPPHPPDDLTPPPAERKAA
ncbi:hypothetical protein [Streptomyces monashensis]|uniref:hypothetical protein n=1 Tax=Streptomyces monashensis TaxID=1678012 RepID=UPI000B0D0D4B|nr:hypothetical protein [Streptomyces monashensis]